MASLRFCFVTVSVISMVSSQGQQKEELPVRLLTKSTERAGKVEVLVEQHWNPVCGDENCWTNETADAVCKSLNFSGGIKRSEDTRNTRGNHSNHASPGCNDTGTEQFSQNSSQIDPYSKDCSSDAHVTCIGAVRLNVRVNSTNMAVVEIFRRNSNGDYKWGGVCWECWSHNNTDVIRRQFDLRSDVSQEESINDRRETLWKHVKYSCLGNESDLSHCTVTEEKCINCGKSKVILKYSLASKYNETCSNDGSCSIGLVCSQDDSKVCRCENETNSFWNEKKKACEKNLENNEPCPNEERCPTVDVDYNEPCTNDESCIRGLVCKQGDNKVCRCKNETSSFWNEKEKSCEERSGLGKKCAPHVDNSCKDNLVCTEDLSSAICRDKNYKVEARKEEDGRENLPIIVGVSIGCLVTVLITSIAVCCYKRRKRNNFKYGKTVSYGDGQSSNLNMDISYSEVNIEGNVNRNEEYEFAQPMNLGNDETYSLALSGVHDPSSGSQTQPSTSVSHDYGVLGGKRAANDDDGMYSHARGIIDTGDYDTFNKSDRDTDANDLYDHTRVIMMENEYDEFQKHK